MGAGSTTCTRAWVVLALLAWCTAPMVVAQTANDCELGLLGVLNALQQNDTHATRMVASWGQGRGDMGSFHECMRVSSDHGANAHYCAVGTGGYDADLVGVCVPKECTETSLPAAIRLLSLLPNLKPLLSPLVDKPARCMGYPPWDAGAVVMLVLVLALVVVVAVCTFVHWKWSSDMQLPGQPSLNASYEAMESAHGIRDSRGGTFVLCFSAFHNWSKLMAPLPGSGEFNALNGLRVLSIVWIVLGHTPVAMMSQMKASSLFYLFDRIVTSWRFALLYSAQYAVDSFFFLSAFLLAHGMHRFHTRKHRMPPYWLTVLHRLLRLWPLYAFLLFVWTFLSPAITLSPFWVESGERPNCTQYWWTNLLYINNFHPHVFNKQCMGWSWFLAVDMQLFLVAPLFVAVYYRHKGAGVLLTVCGVLGSVVANVVVAHWRHLKAGIDIDSLDDLEDEDYDKPWMRAGAYLWGILTYWAYVHVKENRGGELSPRTRHTLSALGYSGVATLTFCILDNTKHAHNVWNDAQNDLWFGLGRTCWAVSLSFFMLPMFLGYRGPVQWFLSLRMWEPLAKLVYGVYLVHLQIMLVMVHNHASYLVYTDSIVAMTFVASVTMCFAAALFFYLLVERPFTNAEKLLMQRLRGRPHSVSLAHPLDHHTSTQSRTKALLQHMSL